MAKENEAEHVGTGSGAPKHSGTQHYIVFSSTAELRVPFPVCTALSLHKYRHKKQQHNLSVQMQRNNRLSKHKVYVYVCTSSTYYGGERLLHFGALTMFAELVQSGSSSTDIH